MSGSMGGPRNIARAICAALVVSAAACSGDPGTGPVTPAHGSGDTDAPVYADDTPALWATVLIESILTLLPGGEAVQFDSGYYRFDMQGRVLTLKERAVALDLHGATADEAQDLLSDWEVDVLSVRADLPVLCDRSVAKTISRMDLAQLAITLTASGFEAGRLEECLGELDVEQMHLKLDMASDETLDAVSGLPGVVELDLRWTGITDEGLENVGTMDELRVLNLYYTSITDEGLKYVARLEKLTRLNLWLTDVTDAGMDHLSALTNLKVLNLGMTRITDEGLMHLQTLTRLRVLNLHMTDVTDAGLVHIASMTRMQVLNLGLTNVTDEGLKYLANMSDLRHLDLLFTGVTDVGLGYISGLEHLEGLVVWETEVTEDGMASLLKMLPRVVFNPMH